MKTIDAQGEENEPHKMHICCWVEVEEAYTIFYIWLAKLNDKHIVSVGSVQRVTQQFGQYNV